MNATTEASGWPATRMGWVIAEGLLRPLHALIALPAAVYLVMLGVMLFRPPDIPFHSVDRVMFLLAVFVGTLRASLMRQPLNVTSALTWPMAALVLLALAGVLSQPYESETWSVFAAKWLVPFVLFHLAQLVFHGTSDLRKLEMFATAVLAYLVLISVAFLAGAHFLILPRFILDESVGIHADRARGPFLQAVANGVSLNLLGLLALDAYRRNRLQGTIPRLALIFLPVAILATLTRSVWLSFAGSLLLLVFLSHSRRLRQLCRKLALAGLIALAVILLVNSAGTRVEDRFDDRSPVEFREAMYRAGWGMFLDKPLLGWGAASMQAELALRVTEFHQEEFYFHNTYLEVAVEHGLLGLLLYVWVLVELFRLATRRRLAPPAGEFMDQQFGTVWKVMVCIYMINAALVVMNYQFVNAFFYTLAGTLAAQHRAMQEAK
jgi:O-antigen ligase